MKFIYFNYGMKQLLKLCLYHCDDLSSVKEKNGENNDLRAHFFITIKRY